MAGHEVIVSSGDLLTVNNEEGESNGDNHKTQVMLHLPPILQGVNCDIADTATTVLAVETHHEDSSEEGEEVEYGYPITCGDSRAVLLFKKFVCPGINVRCVKFNDQLISPKQFVHLAGKATLKDWKRAIRLGGVMLRKMMDSGQIDFYQHDTVCSNTCRSTKFDVVINSTRLPSGKIMQPNSSCLALDTSGGQVPVLTVEVVHDAAEEPLEEKLSTAAQMSPGPAQPVTPITANGYAAKKKRADTPDGVLSLWKGVADSGLMVEVLSSLHTELLATLKGVEDRSEKASLHEADAIILNSLCKMFGLLDSVKQALNLKRSQVEAHNDYVLDEILGKQKVQVRDKKKIKSVKHIRSQYPNRSESRGLSFLYPVKTSQGTQPPSATGSSAASYSQLTVKPHLFRHFSSSTGRYQYARAGRRDSDGHSTTQDGVHEVNETRYQEIFHRFRKEAMKKEDASEIHQEPIHRTEEEPLLIHEEVEEKESFNHIPKVAKERLAVKKPKSK